MILNALVLEGNVQESTFYDQATGAPKQGYSVQLTVLDRDTHEKYECRLTGGFPSLEELQEQRRKGRPVEELREIADRLQAELPEPYSMLQLEVVKFTGKSAAFLKLVCRFPLSNVPVEEFAEAVS